MNRLVSNEKHKRECTFTVCANSIQAGDRPGIPTSHKNKNPI